MRAKVMAMKFDHGLAIGLLLAWPGFLWYHALEPFWPLWTVVAGSVVLLSLAAYLLFDAYQTAKILAEVRSLILDASRRNAGG